MAGRLGNRILFLNRVSEVRFLPGAPCDVSGLEARIPGAPIILAEHDKSKEFGALSQPNGRPRRTARDVA